MQPISRRVAGDGGLDLHLLEWSAQGVPLLLLHGYGNEAHIWDDFAPSVAPYYRTLALDHRGHGDSAWDAEGRYDHETLVRDVEAVTAALGIERLVLVAHSLGGRIATLFAGRHPERHGGARAGRHRTRARRARHHPHPPGDRVESRADLRVGGRVRAAALAALSGGAAARAAAHGAARRAAPRERALRAQAGSGAARTPGARRPRAPPRRRISTQAQWEALAKIPCPTLVVRGAASDVLSADVAERMALEVLPKGSLAVVARAGHSVMTDNPDGFRDAVAAFVLGEG